MTIRKDDSVEKTFPSVDTISDKAQLRKLLLSIFIEEDCKTKLRYFIETLSSGKRIYIERPGQLNKGCDFVIYIEDLLLYKNGNDNPPRHKDLLDDLIAKKNVMTHDEYSSLLKAIEDIYNLKPYKTAIKHLNGITTNVGWSFELILKLSRWLFIEQDITYWAKSGREMLLNEIMKTK